MSVLFPVFLLASFLSLNYFLQFGGEETELKRHQDGHQFHHRWGWLSLAHKHVIRWLDKLDNDISKLLQLHPSDGNKQQYKIRPATNHHKESGDSHKKNKTPQTIPRDLRSKLAHGYHRITRRARRRRLHKGEGGGSGMSSDSLSTGEAEDGRHHHHHPTGTKLRGLVHRLIHHQKQKKDHLNRSDRISQSEGSGKTLDTSTSSMDSTPSPSPESNKTLSSRLSPKRLSPKRLSPKRSRRSEAVLHEIPAGATGLEVKIEADRGPMGRRCPLRQTLDTSTSSIDSTPSPSPKSNKTLSSRLSPKRLSPKRSRRREAVLHEIPAGATGLEVKIEADRGPMGRRCPLRHRHHRRGALLNNIPDPKQTPEQIPRQIKAPPNHTTPSTPCARVSEERIKENPIIGTHHFTDNEEHAKHRLAPVNLRKGPVIESDSICGLLAQLSVEKITTLENS